MSDAVRGMIRIGTFPITAVVYDVWHNVGRKLDVGTPSALFRGAVVLGSFAWAWVATAGLAQAICTNSRKILPPDHFLG